MSTGFYTKSGILTVEHRDSIGIAIWEFLWCVDRTTREYVDEEGNRWGLVLGGTPIQAEDIKANIGTHVQTIRKNLRRLEEKGYIRLKRIPYGHLIEVAKSAKWKPKENAQALAGSNPPAQQPLNFIQAYNKEFGKLMPGTQIQVVRAFIDSGMAEELILEAIKRTGKAGASFKYLEAILIDWDKKGIKTMNQVAIADAEFEFEKQKVKKVGGKARGQPLPAEPPKSRNAEMYRLIYRN